MLEQHHKNVSDSNRGQVVFRTRIVGKPAVVPAIIASSTSSQSTTSIAVNGTIISSSVHAGLTYRRR